MKKRGGLTIKINFTNRWLYSLIALGILIVVGIGVYALTPGVAPNPGHLAGEMAPPSPCTANQFLKFDGTNWVCSSLPTIPVIACSTIVGSADALKTLTSSDTLLKEMIVHGNGQTRVNWQVRTNGIARVSLYKNGVSVKKIAYCIASSCSGITGVDEIITVGTSVWYDDTEDTGIIDGDRVQLRGSTGITTASNVQNFRLGYCLSTPAPEVTVN